MSTQAQFKTQPRLISELSPHELRIARHLALIALFRTPLRDDVNLRALLELVCDNEGNGGEGGAAQRFWNRVVKRFKGTPKANEIGLSGDSDADSSSSITFRGTNTGIPEEVSRLICAALAPLPTADRDKDGKFQIMTHPMEIAFLRLPAASFSEDQEKATQFDSNTPLVNSLSPNAYGAISEFIRKPHRIWMKDVLPFVEVMVWGSSFRSDPCLETDPTLQHHFRLLLLLLPRTNREIIEAVLGYISRCFELYSQSAHSNASSNFESDSSHISHSLNCFLYHFNYNMPLFSRVHGAEAYKELGRLPEEIEEALRDRAVMAYLEDLSVDTPLGADAGTEADWRTGDRDSGQDVNSAKKPQKPKPVVESKELLRRCAQYFSYGNSAMVNSLFSSLHFEWSTICGDSLADYDQRSTKTMTS